MSTVVHIKGISKADALEKANKARDLMNELGLEYPEELDEIADNYIDIKYEEVEDKYDSIYEVNLKKLPNNVEKIRFIISW